MTRGILPQPVFDPSGTMSQAFADLAGAVYVALELLMAERIDQAATAGEFVLAAGYDQWLRSGFVQAEAEAVAASIKDKLRRQIGNG